jgi:diguanylate cyclase (GGDEF)-like protein
VPGPCETDVLAERVRSEVARTEYRHGAVFFHITVSIGIACASPSATGDEILKQADEALYRAKKTKNTVSVGNGNAPKGFS